MVAFQSCSFFLAHPVYNISFLFSQVDVDKNSDTAEAVRIQSMPTFKFYFNGEEVDEVQGASEDKVRANLDKLKDM